MSPMDERLLYWQKKLAGWIRSVSKRAATRFHSADDLRQEADIQIWKCLKTYPEVTGSSFIGLFKTCFCNRLASLLTQQRSKQPCAALNIEIDFRVSMEHPEFWYEDKIRELIRRCEDPRLRKWIKRNLAPGRYASGGMRRWEYEAIRELAARVF